jgi:hypothetical protein
MSSSAADDNGTSGRDTGSDQCSPTGTQAYSFETTDKINWLRHLDQEGYVVLRGAVDADQIDAAKSMLWHDIESMCSATRADPTSWEALNMVSFFFVSAFFPQLFTRALPKHSHPTLHPTLVSYIRPPLTLLCLAPTP